MKRRWLLVVAVGLLLGAGPHAEHGGHHGKALPHPDDPVLQAEHMDLLALVPDKEVTHTAIKDGPWSAAATWKDGKVPTAGANVLIPQGRTVTVDHVSIVALRAVRIDGKLDFAPDRDTGLLADTVVVSPDGELVMGTA